MSTTNKLDTARLPFTSIERTKMQVPFLFPLLCAVFYSVTASPLVFGSSFNLLQGHRLSLV
jgi:hypothetical protein